MYSDLDAYSTHLLRMGHAPSTRKAYSAGVSRYLYMCVQYGLQPCPVDDLAARRYITYLTTQKVNPRTIQVYLSGLRAWYTTAGLEPPRIHTPANQLLLRSVLKQAPLPKRAAPFRVSDLYNLISILPFDCDNMVYLTAMVIIFFGCMRTSELCVHPVSNPVPTVLNQFQLFNNPLRLQYTARTSKTASKGFEVTMGCTGGPICPVCIFLVLIRIRAPLAPDSPVFLLSSNECLSYNHLNVFIKRVTPRLGLDPTMYSPHSLRAGAATAASQAGCTGHQIQRLGRWASQAYTAYIRPSPYTEAAMAATIHSHPI